MRVEVTATNVDGSASAVSAADGAGRRAAGQHVVAPGAPTGTPREASTLTAAPGTLGHPGAIFAYTWVRCAADATR